MSPEDQAGLANRHYDVVIVGAGHGGAQAAVALRQAKFGGSIALIGEEPELPYERPSLSKEYLSGDKAFEQMLIRPAAFWAGQGIAILTRKRVTRVDPVMRAVTAEGGGSIGYGNLVWATGGRPRKMGCSGHDLAGVHTIRNRADLDLIRAELPAVTRVAVIGGGFIGLEVAAVLAKLGKRVTVLEALDRVLARVAGEPLSRFYETEHRARGVEILLNMKVGCLEGKDGRVAGVRTADGHVLHCDLVIVGIGIIPAVEPLLAAGADGGNGVAVDAECRTSLPAIFAIGDCAIQANRFADGRMVRIESVQNASGQAAIVAKAVIGAPAPLPNAVPWFWSNQYDLRLQSIGLTIGHDRAVLRGQLADRAFSIVYMKAGKVIALDCVNNTRDFVQGRRLVDEAAVIPWERLADPSIALKDM